MTSLFLLTFCLGAIIGSFINVVIYRLPIMLGVAERQNIYFRHHKSYTLFNRPPFQSMTRVKNTLSCCDKAFNLAWPLSHCPVCGDNVRPYDNIPLISFLILRGRCRHCQTSLSIQYPLVELACALLAFYSIYHSGFTLQGVSFFFVCVLLLALSIIDLKHWLLPDKLTMTLLWGGLLFHALTSEEQAPYILGAIAGYLSLWSVYQLFRITTGKEGMGYGDFKLLSAIGAWTGIVMLPAIILISSMTGLLIASVIRLRTGQTPRALPFGPSLAIAGVLAIFFPEKIMLLIYSVSY